MVHGHERSVWIIFVDRKDRIVDDGACWAASFDRNFQSGQAKIPAEVIAIADIASILVSAS